MSQPTIRFDLSSKTICRFSGVFDIVENVLVEYVTMSDAENGARIKAFAGPNVGSGIVKNVTYNHFVGPFQFSSYSV